MIDLEDLPEDRSERARVLGMDESLIQEGEELYVMFEQGAIDEIKRK